MVWETWVRRPAAGKQRQGRDGMSSYNQALLESLKLKLLEHCQVHVVALPTNFLFVPGQSNCYPQLSQSV